MNKKTILVVDDEPGILEAVSIMLEDEGYNVSTTANGEDVENLRNGSLPDLILLDVLLSGKDGREITRVLKSKPETKKIPIIMISAHPSAEKSIKECGADDFLPKPFDIDDLLARVEKQLKRSN